MLLHCSVYTLSYVHIHSHPCCVNNKKCGPYKRLRRNGIVRANHLNEPINKHFKALKTKFSDQWNEITLEETQWGKKHFKKML